jgi:hypothetical protein
VKLSTGTKLVVEERAELGILEQGASQVFALGKGALRAEVAKLREGERFIVRTPDAEVEVRGTVFRLARVAGAAACPGGMTTILSVYEGLVVVRAGDREDRVAAGQDWKAACSGPETPIEEREISSQRAERPRATPSARAAPESAATSANRGLQAINDLFADAMDAKRRGDNQHALAVLGRLEVQYPSSHLAESATVERMKILASMDPTAARAVAERYLEHYPDGFARDVAESIVAKSR